jgi:hypothetical protein
MMDTILPQIKHTMPSKSNLFPRLFTLGEWFDRVWYVALMPKHMAALRKKDPIARTSDHDAAIYRVLAVLKTARQSKVNRNIPIRCVYIFTDSLCK